LRYFGTKASTSGHIAKLVNDLTPNATVADAFGGLGTIGEKLKVCGHQVTTCDVLTFPHMFQISRIECNNIPEFHVLKNEYNFESHDAILNYLNSQKAPRSWIVKEYAQKRGFFTESNAILLAGSWNTICRWDRKTLLNKHEKAFLISSLINSMDKVANTAGTYYAYLKKYHRKALRPFIFSWIPVFQGEYLGRALLGDALNQLSGKSFDVLYLDPPYNNRNYASYYHLPETLAGLKKKKLKDATRSGVPKAAHPFSENIRQGMKMSYIEDLVSKIHWQYLVFHYCDNALIPLETIRNKLQTLGTMEEHIIPTIGYTTTKESRVRYHNVFTVKQS